MKYFDADQVRALLDYPYLIDGLEMAHGEDMDAMQDMLLEQPSSPDGPPGGPAGGGPTYFFLRAAWQNRKAAGVKLVTVFPENAGGGEGLPSVQAVYVIFDGANGRPLAALDGTVLTWRKTAADSALGARFLARQDAQTLLMVGAGAMAPHLIEAHRTARPSINRVVLWNRTAEKAEKLARSLNLNGAGIEASRDLEAAAKEADIICTATLSPLPLIHGEWLKPGAHLDLVGAFTATTREADDQAVRRSRVFVDCRLTTIGEVGDITIPLETGVLSEDQIQADLYQLCRGEKRGRETEEEITFFKNGGGGHLDLMCARLLLERAG